jgi:peptidoglycan/LPS O-acetylase OafA/YrhL
MRRSGAVAMQETTVSAKTGTASVQDTTSRLQSWLTARSLGDLMVAHKGVGPGFDLLRLGLAVLIFYGHCRFALMPSGTLEATVANGIAGTATPQAIGGLLGFIASVRSHLFILYVPMFFALSGFLVAGSAVRLGNVGTFLRFRALRIFPALIFEVALSALLLGLFFSTIPFWMYVTHPDFLRYFGNIFGFVWFRLPGVFESNPLPGIVNINLWTLPAEFYCYLLLSGIMLARLLSASWRVFALFVAGSVGLITASLIWGVGVQPGIYSTMAIVFYFLVGVAFFLWRDRIPMHPLLFAGAVPLVLLLLPYPHYAFLMAGAVCYITVYIGFMPFLALPFMRGRDYSYGIYLYGFPITQALIALSPGISMVTLVTTGLVITVLIAMMSWHFVEKPCLKLKR